VRLPPHNHLYDGKRGYKDAGADEGNLMERHGQHFTLKRQDLPR